jgi:hypothetical protein
MKRVIWTLGATALLASCASSGTEPHAMTAAQHEAAAKGEERASTEHTSRYDAAQAIVVPPTVNCPFSGAYASAPVGAGCYGAWTSVMNPTKQHLEEGRHHAEVAARHRAASQALRDAEARACQGVPEGDRDVSPFYHREDITAVRSVSEHLPFGRERLTGAEVVFTALPGMTAEWLQRVVDCHLARNAVVGDEEGTMRYCPLAVPHVKATVRSEGGGFAVDVTSQDEVSVREVIARAEALKPKSSSTAGR